MTIATAAASHTAEALWARARAMFARALEALGGAARIAALPALTPELRRRIIAWLYPLEHIVRKLLLAEAAAFHRIECERARRQPRIELVPVRGMAVHWENGSARPPAAQCTTDSKVDVDAPPEAARSKRPETWSASFSFALPRDPFAVPNAHAPRIRALWDDPRTTDRGPSGPHLHSVRARGSDDPCSCAPFRRARRFEALRRVLENPARYAARLARILVRAVRRMPQIVRRAAMAPPRTGDYDSNDPDLSIHATAIALPVPDSFPDSS